MSRAGSAFNTLVAALAALALVMVMARAVAQEDLSTDFSAWPRLVPTFESTGGGGIMIGGYNPVVRGDKCVTEFTATEPSGKVYYNVVEFDALSAAGGVLCREGKWRARDGSASGSTPLRVFWKDGVAYRSP
jgi:hypothetical protein